MKRNEVLAKYLSDLSQKFKVNMMVEVQDGGEPETIMVTYDGLCFHPYPPTDLDPKMMAELESELPPEMRELLAKEKVILDQIQVLKDQIKALHS